MFTLGARVRVSLATNVNITEFGHSPRARERCLGLVPKQLVTGYLGCVHTWCPSTSTRALALAQNGAVFIRWEFWRGYLKYGVFTLMPIKNRSRAPCSGTRSERSLKIPCLNTILFCAGTHAPVLERKV